MTDQDWEFWRGVALIIMSIVVLGCGIHFIMNGSL
jgi:hypothetical protein